MAYDHDLADRLREQLASTAGVTEQAMFGGLAFLVRGHIVIAASGHGGALVRVDPAEQEALLARPGVEPAVMGGRPRAGWLRVPARRAGRRRPRVLGAGRPGRGAGAAVDLT